MDGEYFDLDRILAEEQPFTVVWNTDSFQLGLLDPEYRFRKSSSMVSSDWSSSEARHSRAMAPPSPRSSEFSFPFSPQPSSVGVPSPHNPRDNAIWARDTASLSEFSQETSDDEDLHSGARMEMPFWLAEFLCRRDFVRIEIPNHYQESFLKVITADPFYASLSKYSPFFFELGAKLANLLEDASIQGYLLKILVSHFGTLLDKSQSKLTQDSDSIRRLTQLEKYLFSVGHTSMLDVSQWKSGSSARMEPPPLLYRCRQKRGTMTRFGNKRVSR